MNRNIANKNKVSSGSVIFWSVMGILVLIFIGFVILKFVNSKGEKTLKDLVNIKEQQVFEQKGTYYVYVYSIQGVTDEKTELDVASELEETITNYLNFEKTNKDAPKLFGMLVDSSKGSYENYRTLIKGNSKTDIVGISNFNDLKINVKNVPMLFKVENGKIVAQYLTVSDIEAILKTK